MTHTPRLSHAQLDGILRNIAHHGHMEIAMRPATYEALLADATGQYRELYETDMQYVDAPALEALVTIARANLRAAEAQPRQTFTAAMWAQLPREYTDPYPEGQAVVSLESTERPMTAEEVARGPRGSMGGTIISMGFPAMLVLATVKNPLAFAERVAQLLTADTKGNP